MSYVVFLVLPVLLVLEARVEGASRMHTEGCYQDVVCLHVLVNSTCARQTALCLTVVLADAFILYSTSFEAFNRYYDHMPFAPDIYSCRSQGCMHAQQPMS